MWQILTMAWLLLRFLWVYFAFLESMTQICPLQVIRFCAICSERGKSNNDHFPIHKRCKEEGKSYTTISTEEGTACPTAKVTNKNLWPAGIGSRFKRRISVLVIRALTTIPMGVLAKLKKMAYKHTISKRDTIVYRGIAMIVVVRTIIAIAPAYN